jgi:hypothetical protein
VKLKKSAYQHSFFGFIHQQKIIIELKQQSTLYIFHGSNFSVMDKKSLINGSGFFQILRINISALRIFQL